VSQPGERFSIEGASVSCGVPARGHCSIVNGIVSALSRWGTVAHLRQARPRRRGHGDRLLGWHVAPSRALAGPAGLRQRGLLALIPLAPGGLAFVERGSSARSHSRGVSGPDALFATLAYRLVSYWLPIPAGGVAYLAFLRRYP
jgi:hypothetical protein